MVSITWHTLPSDTRVAYLTRADWHAGPHRRGYPLDPSRILRWFIHHTVMSTGNLTVLSDQDLTDTVGSYMRRLQNARPDLGSEVPYPFVGFNAGPSRAVIAEGTGLAWVGAHTACHNSSSTALAFAGDARTEPWQDELVEAFRWLAARTTPQVTLPTLGHQHAGRCLSPSGTDWNATDCPSHYGLIRLPELQPLFRPSPPSEPVPSAPSPYAIL